MVRTGLDKNLRFFFKQTIEPDKNINDLVLELHKNAKDKYGNSELWDVHTVKKELLSSGFFEEIPDKEADKEAKVRQFILITNKPWYCIYSGTIKPNNKL